MPGLTHKGEEYASCFVHIEDHFGARDILSWVGARIARWIGGPVKYH